MPESKHHDHATTTAKRGGSLRAAKAVAWGFFGVRKNAGYESDTRIGATTVIVTALVCAAVFVGTLIGIVSFVIG